MQRETCSSFCGAAGRSEGSIWATVTLWPSTPPIPSSTLLPTGGYQNGDPLWASVPCRYQEHQVVSGAGKGDGKGDVGVTIYDQSRGVQCQQGKGDPLWCFSRPRIPISPWRPAGLTQVTQSCPGSLGLPSPSSVDSPVPRPIASRTLRHVPGRRHSGAAVRRKVWMHGWETLITTTPRPTKAPTGKPPYTHHRQSPSLQGKLFIRPHFGASLWTAEAATAAVRRAPELLALFLPPPSLGRLSPPPPSLLPPPPPFLPSRGPRTHPETPSALGYSHCGLTQPTRHGCQSGAGCVCGVQGRRPNGAGGGMVEPLSFQPRPPAHSPSLILGCQQQ